VIRGHRLRSLYAPASGYRYDGLYRVTEASQKPGKSGHIICVFRFVRCAGQTPLPGAAATPVSPPLSPLSQIQRSLLSDLSRQMFQQGASLSSTDDDDDGDEEEDDDRDDEENNRGDEEEGKEEGDDDDEDEGIEEKQFTKLLLRMGWRLNVPTQI